MSDIPLDAIFNDKIDAIKSFERRNGKNPAPIKLSMWKDFQEPAELESPDNENSITDGNLSLLNIRCPDYGISKNIVFNSEPESKMYFSDLQRQGLQERLERRIR